MELLWSAHCNFSCCEEGIRARPPYSRNWYPREYRTLGAKYPCGEWVAAPPAEVAGGSSCEGGGQHQT